MMMLDLLKSFTTLHIVAMISFVVKMSIQYYELLSVSKIHQNELSLCHKLKFSNPYIFAT